MARLLILSALHLCRNPRVVKEATSLGRAGHDVTVLAVSTTARFELMDRELVRGLPFRRVTLDLIGVKPWARVRSLLSRGGTWLARLALEHLSLESPQALGPAYGLLMLARSFPADLTIVHTEIPLWIARTLIRDGRRVAVDIEDWYSEDLLYADRRGRPLRLLRAVENFALNHASYSSVTSESMASALAERYNCPKPRVIRNTFPLQPRTRLDRPMGHAPPALIWFSQTIGPGRGLELFFSAWNQTAVPSRVYLLGDVRPTYREQLLAGISAMRRAQIEFLPLVTPDVLPDQLTTFDVGLALESHWPLNRDITITNKILQYINAGLAVIASDTAGQVEIMRAAPGIGLLVSAHETTEFATQLDRLLADRTALRACQHAARTAAATQFCWELDERELVASVSRVLETPVT